nr:MAG: D-alanyl-D-alanine dipeptidase [Pseudomonadota bacterium]
MRRLLAIGILLLAPDEAAPEPAAEAEIRPVAASFEAAPATPGTKPRGAPATAPAATRPERGQAPALELVDVQALIPDLVLDLRYATDDNLFGEPVYPEKARCLLLRPTAEKLARVAKRLREEDGTRLRVFDCYRPHSVQFRLWQIMPVRGYVAPPRPGSVHNRGGAVDLTLASPEGEPLPMPTDFDELSDRAWHSYEGATEEQKRNRARLKAAMEAEGFRAIRKEWWHYEDPEARQAPVRDLPLDG